MPFLSSPRTRHSGIQFAGLALLAFLGVASDARASTQPVDGFDPSANGIVNTIVVQPDAKILIGGYFTQLHPFGGQVSGNGYIARLNHDGSVDSGFSPNANGVVRTIVLQPNGQILVGGTFTSIQPTGGSAQVTRNYVARLNADGSLDSVFNPNTNGVVYAIAYQPNGQIVIGGSFTTVQPGGAGSPTTRNHVARFNADGSLDTTFDPNTDRTVLALALQPNGQIVVGGGFSTFKPNGAGATTARSCAARLNSDGSLDSGFDPEPNASVNSLLVLPTGQIIMGGQFVTVRPNGTSGASQCDFVGRFNSDGSLDSSFIVNPLASVNAVAIQPDGKLLIGGTFTQIYPENNLSAVAAPYAARINTDGSVDESFLPSPNQAIQAIAVQSDGNVLLGGYFTSLQPLDKQTPTPRNFIARVNGVGVPDSTISPDTAGTVFTTVALSNGQMLVGGTFLSIGGTTRDYLARINADGSLDTSFVPTVNGPVQALAVQSNGQILVGGSFSQVDGISRNNLARLNPDGTIDGVFNPSPNANINVVALQTGGQILIGGNFTALAPNGSTTAYGINSFARLNSDGSLDLTFNPSPNGGVFAVAFQTDGRIVIGGGFTNTNGLTRSYIARLLPTGAIDPQPFDPEANAPIYALAIQSDGKIVMGGSFTGVIPQTGKTGTPGTLTTPYGTTIVVPAPGTGATTPIYISHLARLNTDGTLDTTFFPDPTSDVLSVALQSDGSIVVAGVMTSFAPYGYYGGTSGTVRNYIGRVSSSGAIDTGFNPNANALINSMSLLSNGHILIGGSFTTLQPNGAPSPTFVNLLAILNPDGTIDTTFSAGSKAAATGKVEAFAQQPNGQVLVAGSFSPLGGSPGAYLSRLNGDGSADITFNTGVDGPVNSLAVLPNGASTLTPTNSAVWLEVNGAIRHSYSASSNGEIDCSAQQADGKLILGGLFSNFAGTSGLQNLVRLNSDGSVDTTFTPTPNGVVSAVLIQSDGKIVIGGGFTNVNSVNNAYLARLNANGTIDSSYAPQPNLQVLTLALQPNGQVIAGGDFTLLVPTVASGTAPTFSRNYLARINTDGTVDSTFNPDPSGPPYTIAVLPSGQIVLGGAFSSFTPGAGTTVDYVRYLARVNGDGSIDTGFYPDPNNPVSAISVLANGQIIVGGTFTGFQQNANVGNLNPAPISGPIVSKNFVARVNTNGTVDSSFDPNPNGGIVFLTVQPNGQIIFGGNFSDLQPNETGIPANRENIARVSPNGSVDPSFDPGFNGTVDTIAVLSDGSLFAGGNFSTIQEGGALLIGGAFANVGGSPAANLARLNADGTFDSAFTAHPDGAVNSMVTLSSGLTFVGGAFANIDGQSQPNLVRLKADGSIDSTFSAAVNAPVNAMALQPNGELLIGGLFTSVGGRSQAYLARLGSSGSPDSAFSPSLNGAVNSIVYQPNGQVVIAGAFTNVAGQTVGRIARLNSDGSIDSSFNPNANGTVQALAPQLDGTYYVTGTFTSIGGQPISYAARIGANGAVDTSFNPNVNGPVYAALVQPDGKVMIGGSFTTVGGLNRVDIARFAAPTPVTQSVSVSADQSALSWTRGGSAPAFSSVQFEETIDGTHWTNVGQASTADGLTWRLTGVAPTGSSTFLVRATGISPSSQYSSSGLVQVVYLANTLPVPVVNSPAEATGAPGTAFSFVVTATQSPQSFSASGLPPGLSINAATGVISGTPTTSGSYFVTVTATNSAGFSQSTLTILISTAGTSPFSPSSTSSANRLLNLSSRADLTGTQNLIAGFVVSGTGTKTLLLRAIGPGLNSFGVPGYMPSPELDLYSSAGSLMSKNTGWTGSLSTTFAQVGAFSLPAGSADVALLATLAPGSYTMHVYSPSGSGGVVLTEIYDASPSPLTSAQRLINISARGTVSSGAGAVIGGFVISGSSAKSVLIRGIGPGLAAFSITDSLADPVLIVYDSNGNIVAKNVSWLNQTVSGLYQSAVSTTDIISTDANVGAFALSSQNADTALIANLPPGAYTFQITSASNKTGEVLGEVYEIP
jgi:uncharacterized delta-60 repeat protein